jgi:hypothetical protein
VQAAPAPGGTQVRVVGLGDSFAEFREYDGVNFYRIAERRARSAGFPVNVINLGEAGTGVRRYFRNLQEYGDRLVPDLAIFAIYLGNDLLDYELQIRTWSWAEDAPADPPAAQTLREYVKRRSIAFSAGVRLLKHYLPMLRRGSFDRNVERLTEIYGLDPGVVEARIDEADPGIVALARADAINSWDLAFGLVRPRLYVEMLGLETTSGFPQALDLMLADFDEIVAYCTAQAIRSLFVLIPPSIQVDARYHAYYRRLGYDVPTHVVGPSHLDRALRAYLEAHAIDVLDLGPALREEDATLFLGDDLHFNATGQVVAGDALFGYLRDRGLMSPGAHPLATDPLRAAVADRRVLEWRP